MECLIPITIKPQTMYMKERNKRICEEGNSTDYRVYQKMMVFLDVILM